MAVRVRVYTRPTAPNLQVKISRFSLRNYEGLMAIRLFPFATCNECCKGCRRGSHDCSNPHDCQCSHLQGGAPKQVNESQVANFPQVLAKVERDRRHRKHAIAAAKSQLCFDFERRPVGKNLPAPIPSLLRGKETTSTSLVRIRIKIEWRAKPLPITYARD